MIIDNIQISSNYNDVKSEEFANIIVEELNDGLQYTKFDRNYIHAFFNTINEEDSHIDELFNSGIRMKTQIELAILGIYKVLQKEDNDFNYKKYNIHIAIRDNDNIFITISPLFNTEYHYEVKFNDISNDKTVYKIAKYEY